MALLKKSKNIEIKTFDKNINLKPNFNKLNQIKNWRAKSALICLPTYLHTSYILKLISTGFKYILVEKPISNNFKNLNKIKEFIKKYRVKIFVVTNMRYHPGIKLIKKHVHLVGKVTFVKAYYKNNLKNMYGKKLIGHFSNYHKLGGGILYDACHEIDYLKYLFGPVKRSNSIAFAEKNLNATDRFLSIIKHKSEVISTINSSFLSNKKRRGCEINGTDGTLVWSSEGSPGKENIKVIFISKKNKIKKIYNHKNFNHNEPYARQIEEFELMKKKKKYDMSSYDDGLNTLSIMLNAKNYGIKKF